MRKARTFVLAVTLLMLVGLGVKHFPSAEEQGPYVTWAAMQRTWNKISPRNLEITQFEPTADGYLVFFAPALIMNVVMKGDQVRSLRLQYDSTNDPGGSGQFFLQGVTTVLGVGSYSWPQEEREKVEAEFAGIASPKLTYSYRATQFTRQSFPNGLWEFFMEYQLKP